MTDDMFLPFLLWSYWTWARKILRSYYRPTKGSL